MFPDKCVNPNSFSEADATIDILVLLAKNKKYGIHFESIYKNREIVVNEDEPLYYQKLLQLIKNELVFNDIQSKHPEIAFSIFYEPDLLSELPTAIAIFEDGRGIVSKALSGLGLATK